MTVSYPCLNHWYAGIFHHRANQPSPAPWDKYIDIPIAAHHLHCGLPGRILNQLYSACRHTASLRRAGHNLCDLTVAQKSFFSAAQHTSIPAFYAERNGIRRHIGPGLKNDPYNAHRYGSLFYLQSVGALYHLQRQPYRVRQRRHLFHAHSHIRNTLARQCQAIHHHLSYPSFFRMRQILGLGLQDLLLPLYQGFCHCFEHLIFLCSIQQTHPSGRFPRLPCLLQYSDHRCPAPFLYGKLYPFLPVCAITVLHR